MKHKCEYKQFSMPRANLDLDLEELGNDVILLFNWQSFSSMQATGAVLLIVGLWIALKLHKYLEVDSDVASALPLLFSGLGLFVLVLASAACQCAVNGAAPKLYIVSIRTYSAHDRPKTYSLGSKNSCPRSID